ncbi:hypothetical protein ZOSMA_11G01110 [Zostera marina]|uniref:Uncharacterized protein n=1 Tax=Zostera marina TaxID=29655 RepID=A0A0K9Q1P7_ZOSMR|nr:hypothetical protein ZOSMA_11G01110 [Zostera marina]
MVCVRALVAPISHHDLITYFISLHPVTQLDIFHPVSLWSDKGVAMQCSPCWFS